MKHFSFLWALCGCFCAMACEKTSVSPCGDGIIQSTHSEECDGEHLDGQTCWSLGFSRGSGALSCSSSCRFNKSLCIPKNPNADLSDLTVTSGILAPAFSPVTTSYFLKVPLSVETLTVEATPSAPFATIAISAPQPMALLEGDNVAAVEVTAEDGNTKIYHIHISREATMNHESPYIGTLVFVSGGKFHRDSLASNESEVSAFRMSQHEITRAQWMAVTGWEDPTDPTISSGEQDPVMSVNWYDTIAFCNKLSLREGLEPVYALPGVDFATLSYGDISSIDDETWNAVTANWAANGYRLPTEMEWMWAAMGADAANPGAINTTGYAKSFAGSNGIDNAIGDYVVFGYNSSHPGATETYRSNPVGSKLANELGLHDMSGNAWEWVWDWSAEIPSGELFDYRGPDTDGNVVFRVIRSGCWSMTADTFYLTFRDHYAPRTRVANFGFRVVQANCFD